MNYKTNVELKNIIESDLENVTKNDKEKAKKILLDREGKSIDELIYEQSLKQSGKLNSINNILIFFLVLAIFSIIASSWLLIIGS